MVVRNNDSRRRRIVVDPNNKQENSAESLPIERGQRRLSRLYKAGSERRNQWKTTDLLPKRGWTVTLIAGLVLFAISLMNVFAVHSPKWIEYIGASGVASFQLSGRATFAAWFSSFLLIISGFASLQIYALRQHRQDDYRGSYRLWLWIAGLLLLASVNCVVDLTGTAVELVRAMTSLSLPQSLISVVVFQLVLLSALVARGSFEMRESKAALSLVILVWIAYAGAAVLRLPIVKPALANIDADSQGLVLGNLVLIGTASLFLSIVFFGRFVYLQALGIVKQKLKSQKAKKAKPKTQPKKKSPAKAKPINVTDPVEPLKTATVKETISKPKPSTNKNSERNAEYDESDLDEGIIRMSKSELRRQRKKQNQNRRAA